MNSISVQYKPINIFLTEGCKVPPYGFRFVDANGDDITDYTPSLFVANSKGKATLLTCTQGDGLKKSGGTTTLDFTATAPEVNRVSYWAYMDVLISGVGTLPAFAGLFAIAKKGVETGGVTTALGQIIKFPIVPVVGGGYEFSPADFSFSDFKIN